MPSHRIGRLNGGFVVSIYDDAGKRTNRYRLEAKTRREAEFEGARRAYKLTRPAGRTVADLWNVYTDDKQGRAIIATMVHTWKALKERFAPMQAEAITIADCRAHTAARRKAGLKDGTIATELGHLRLVLKWAEKSALIERAPYVEKPAAPRRREHHLTRAQAKALIEAAPWPHLRLYIILALATGARNAALLELTWDRVDFGREEIDLRNPAITRPHKGRAIVPMNRMVRAALAEAQEAALSDHVIEWGGQRIQSVKRGVKAAAKAAGIADVHPHLFRHTAAVHMAEAGVSMDEIAQTLGHDDVSTTRRVYARFSPGHLRTAVAALEYDPVSVVRKDATRIAGTDMIEGPEMLVGATGIEPVTPTVSRKRA